MTLDNRTSPLPSPASHQPPTVAKVAAALNEDGMDARMWWDLDEGEQSARTEKHNRDWWARHALVKAQQIREVTQ